MLKRFLKNPCFGASGMSRGRNRSPSISFKLSLLTQQTDENVSLNHSRSRRLLTPQCQPYSLSLADVTMPAFVPSGWVVSFRATQRWDRLSVMKFVVAFTYNVTVSVVKYDMLLIKSLVTSCEAQPRCSHRLLKPLKGSSKPQKVVRCDPA